MNSTPCQLRDVYIWLYHSIGLRSNFPVYSTKDIGQMVTRVFDNISAVADLPEGFLPPISQPCGFDVVTGLYCLHYAQVAEKVVEK